LVWENQMKDFILFFKNLALIDIFKGMSITLSYFFSSKVTIPYPEQQIPRSPRFRGIHALRRYSHGEERCIACKLCEAVCPALAITIESDQREDGSRRTTSYEIDLFKCIFCGLCEESCPVDAIVETRHPHFVILERGQNILDKPLLLALGDRYEVEIARDRQQE